MLCDMINEVDSFFMKIRDWGGWLYRSKEGMGLKFAFSKSSWLNVRSFSLLYGTNFGLCHCRSWTLVSLYEFSLSIIFDCIICVDSFFLPLSYTDKQ